MRRPDHALPIAQACLNNDRDGYAIENARAFSRLLRFNSFETLKSSAGRGLKAALDSYSVLMP
jgi:hypothetical protein